MARYEVTKTLTWRVWCDPKEPGDQDPLDVFDRYGPDYTTGGTPMVEFGGQEGDTVVEVMP